MARVCAECTKARPVAASLLPLQTSPFCFEKNERITSSPQRCIVKLDDGSYMIPGIYLCGIGHPRRPQPRTLDLSEAGGSPSMPRAS